MDSSVHSTMGFWSMESTVVFYIIYISLIHLWSLVVLALLHCLRAMHWLCTSVHRLSNVFSCFTWHQTTAVVKGAQPSSASSSRCCQLLKTDCYHNSVIIPFVANTCGMMRSPAGRGLASYRSGSILVAGSWSQHGIRSPTPCIWCCTNMLRIGPPTGQHADISFTQWSKNVGLLPQAKFHICQCKNVGLQSPKLWKFGIFPIHLPLRGESFARFLRNSRHLYASIGSFYVFNLVGFGEQVAFSPQIFNSPGGKTTDYVRNS